jgi:Tfp pilus assembly protein PilO
MTAANRSLIAVIAAIVALGAFWLLAVAPKRDKASKLADQVEKEKANLAQQQQAAAAGQEARHDFTQDYQQLVLLGKAVPAGDDSGSLVVQLDGIADHAGVGFRKLELSSAGEAAPAPAPVDATAAAAPTTTDPSATTTTPAPPTEASAATLPIGATVGPAGLAVMPYNLQFTGTFFQIADFLQGLDRLVETTNGRVAVDGRLMTVDGFSLTQNAGKGFPALQADLYVTTYVTPPGQGVTAGATTTAPAPTDTTTATTTATTTTPTTTP